MALQVAILGSVEPRMNGEVVGVPAGKQRALLTLLAVRAPHPVSAESAAEALWPRAAPAEAMRSLHVTVSRLRRSLGSAGSALETVASGYRLAVEAEAIDARHFETLVNAARAARSGGDAAAARCLLDDALELWRGPALADVGYESFAQTEIARLQELHVAALEERIDARLAEGEHALVVAELEQLSAEHPSRERLVGLLMLALYRCDRQTDALEVYTRGRLRLEEELGLEPSPDLQRLQEAILRHDQSLREPSTSGAARTTPRPAAREAVPPVPATQLIGRDRERRQLLDVICTDDARLVTLVGPGGVGKTRLALEIARAAMARFHDGVAWVELAAVGRAEHVPGTVARALAVTPLPGETPAQALLRQLEASELLLVIDNFEHVLDAGPLVAELLARCATLTVLVTSREALDLSAEHVYPVAPLALPACGDRLTRAGVEASPAGALFLAAARRHDRSLRVDDASARAIAEICTRLDGLPLAIELAAGRLGLLGPAELSERLGGDLALLGPGPRDAARRHRTLDATLQWSHALLSPAERSAFEALSVFASGAQLDAAEHVTRAPLTVLEALADKHLVERRASGQLGRLMMLNTIRVFARRRLDRSPQAAAVYRRHAEQCISTITAISAEIERTHAPDSLAAFDRELDDCRAAVTWTLRRPEPELALKLTAALAYPCWARYLNEEPLNWLEQALALRGSPSAHAAALNATAFLLAYRPDREARTRAAVAAQASIELRRSLGDQAGTAESLFSLAKVQLFMDRVDEAYESACEAERLALASGSEPTLRNALHVRALAAKSLEEALSVGDELASRLRASGNAWHLAELRSAMVYCAALPHDDLDVAVRLAAEGLAAAKQTGDAWKIAGASGNAGLAALCFGQYDEAAAHFSAEVHWFLRHSAWSDDLVYEGLNGLAAVAAGQRNDELAARLAGAADVVTEERHSEAIAKRLESRFFAPSRARLGDQGWEAAYAAGREWTPDQALAAVRGALEAPSSVGA